MRLVGSTGKPRAMRLSDLVRVFQASAATPSRCGVGESSLQSSTTTQDAPPGTYQRVAPALVASHTGHGSRVDGAGVDDQRHPSGRATAYLNNSQEGDHR